MSVILEPMLLIVDKLNKLLVITHLLIILVLTGQITPEEAFTHPQRNIITKVMGTDKRVSPDLFIKRLNFYDYLLLNSDGLTDYVKDNEIKRLLVKRRYNQKIMVIN